MRCVWTPGLKKKKKKNPAHLLFQLSTNSSWTVSSHRAIVFSPAADLTDIILPLYGINNLDLVFSMHDVAL